MTSAPRPPVRGVDVADDTRCAHWHSPRDIIAIRMKCCGAYFACRECHDALEKHPAQVWPINEWNMPAVLCGACGTELSIRTYMDCKNICPACNAAFNPGCRTHYHLYFETVPETK